MTDRPDIKLYNTLTRQKETFEPIDAKNVRMYVCGPTVYDYAHIGNARPAIVFDVLFRLLRHIYGEEHVTYVRNITDVDDKINARALKTHGEAIAAGTMPLNEAIRRRHRENGRISFKKTWRRWAALKPDASAAGHGICFTPQRRQAPTWSTMIQTLHRQGTRLCRLRGEKGREVLFRVASMKDYGALSNRKLDEQQAGARVAVESHKENAGDFVLWKESSDNEPGWDGVFDSGSGPETIHGRPGWHIECSAMSEAYLGKVFDIHGGGLDLIFPHHENEIAQSCCVHGTDRMANIWMHNGFLQVEGQKMSKSLGNFHTVHDVLHTEKVGGRKWPGEVVRLAMLMTHYREPIDFSVKRLEEAENILVKWKTVSDRSRSDMPSRTSRLIGDDVSKQVIAALGQDLNLTNVIAHSHELDRAFRSGDKDAGVELFWATRFLGFSFREILSDDEAQMIELADAELREISQQIKLRSQFIAEKNWTEADRIRDELLEQGIQLKDSKDPETGERVTTWEVKR